MKQYELWWAELPLPSGTRPVLLLSRDHAYRVLERVLAVEVTSVIRGIPQELALGTREGLARASVANFDRLRTVPVSRLRGRVGKLRGGRVVDAKHALGHALGWIELTRLERWELP
jgi:mRNA-degrading endonuclease toxin of MazEF toxin-antitoxin module